MGELLVSGRVYHHFSPYLMTPVFPTLGSQLSGVQFFSRSIFHDEGFAYGLATLAVVGDRNAKDHNKKTTQSI